MTSAQTSEHEARCKEIADDIKSLKVRLGRDYNLIRFIPSYAPATINDILNVWKIEESLTPRILQPQVNALSILEDWENRIKVIQLEELYFFPD